MKRMSIVVASSLEKKLQKIPPALGMPKGLIAAWCFIGSLVKKNALAGPGFTRGVFEEDNYAFKFFDGFHCESDVLDKVLKKYFRTSIEIYFEHDHGEYVKVCIEMFERENKTPSYILKVGFDLFDGGMGRIKEEVR